MHYLQQVQGIPVLVGTTQLDTELVAGLLQNASFVEHVLDLLAFHNGGLVHDLPCACACECVCVCVCMCECVCLCVCV
jgi:hypothetical protein